MHALTYPVSGRFRPSPATFICVAGAVLSLILPGFVARGAPSLESAIAASGLPGGLAVHLNLGEAGREYGADSAWRVVGLEPGLQEVLAAREQLLADGQAGRATSLLWDGAALPFGENLVNLLVAADPSAVTRDELLRVLAPGGMVMARTAAGWGRVLTKPRPAEMDDWTHYWHDPSGNPVATDTLVGPPEHYQWIGSPRWSRHHDHMASMSALVSDGGRLFYIIDEGSKASIQLPPDWGLVARDAFNGVILWRHPIAGWHTHLWPLKSGPAHLPRRLVALDDRVFVTLGITAPVSEIDARTGLTLREFSGTAATEEFLVTDDTLLCLVDPDPARGNNYLPKHTYVWDNSGSANRDWAWKQTSRRIVAVARGDGSLRWQVESPVAPLTLATLGDHVFFQDGERVVCLDAATGKERWKSEPLVSRSPINTSFGARLIARPGLVLYSGGKNRMVGLDAGTGRQLWSAPHPRSGHQSPEDLLVIGNLVWSGATANGKDSGIYTGRDVRTGEVKSEFPPDVDIYWFHQRCHPSKATVNYLLPSRTGIEFIDFREQHWDVNHWVRGGCIYGIMPANGLVYAPPHDCACYLEAKLSGFSALAPKSRTVAAVAGKPSPRLLKGPAFAAVGQEARQGESAEDWPTYRCDARRSGAVPQTLPDELEFAWTAKLPGRLSSPVVAGNRVFLAQVDAHTVHARDARTGERLWHFVAGGRVDSPPTIWQGRVLFGSADGCIYSLRASDGELVWRFRAAPEERFMLAYEQVESAWPVSGSVLVHHGLVHAVAGRSMFLDGGLRLMRLDAATGELRGETVLNDRDPATGQDLQVYVKGTTMPVALPDILSTDGRFLYMRSQKFQFDGTRVDVPNIEVTDQAGEGTHLFAPGGFLDDTWFHRSYWMYGRAAAGGWGGWPRAGRYAPSGRLLVHAGDTIYGFGRKPEFMAQSSVLEYQLFAAPKEPDNEAIRRVVRAENRMNQDHPKNSGSVADWKHRANYPLSDRTATAYEWTREKLPLLARAMVLAGDTLVVAGPPDVADEQVGFLNIGDPALNASRAEQQRAWEGALGGRLLAVNAATGEPVIELELSAPPVWDGMVAARGRLFIALQNGEIVCLRGAQTPRVTAVPSGGSPDGTGQWPVPPEAGFSDRLLIVAAQRCLSAASATRIPSLRALSIPIVSWAMSSSETFQSVAP